MSTLQIILAGNIPYEKAPELQDVYDKLQSAFDIQIVEPTEANVAAAAEEMPDAQALVIPWTPEPLVTADILNRLKHLKVIVSTYGGVKRNVNVDEALARGIRLTCTGGQRARSVAEFTLALMMDGLLNVSRTHHDMRGGKRFPRYGYTRELTGRTVGLVGFGAVTRELLQLLKPFDVQPLVYSRHAATNELSKWNARSASLMELAQRSDVVVLVTGLTAETHHMINKAFLLAMQDEALLVNTARGKLINEKELIEELEKGRIRAALDVYEDEPLDQNSPLRSMENVVLTAHSANSTREMDVGRWKFALGELQAFAAGQSLEGELSADHIARMSDD